MKYILILLISFAFGQIGSITDSDDTHTWLDFTDPIELPQQDSVFCSEPIIEREIIRYYEQQKLQQPIIFGDILDYAEECYNDSIEDYYIRVLDNAEIIYYRHPEPTFSGFIEWLGL